MSAPLTSISLTAERPVLPARDGASVVESFDRHLRAAGRSAAQEQARQAAEQLVSIAFVEPALKMLRESSLAAEPFAPGDTERRFAPLLDQMFSVRVTRSANFPLVDRLEAQLLPDTAGKGEGVNILG